MGLTCRTPTLIFLQFNEPPTQGFSSVCHISLLLLGNLIASLNDGEHTGTVHTLHVCI